MIIGKVILLIIYPVYYAIYVVIGCTFTEHVDCIAVDMFHALLCAAICLERKTKFSMTSKNWEHYLDSMIAISYGFTAIMNLYNIFINDFIKTKLPILMVFGGVILALLWSIAEYTGMLKMRKL